MTPALLAPPATAALPAHRPTPSQLPVDAHRPLSGPSAAAAPTVPAAPRHLDSCCCGSVACHAGVMAALLTIDNPYRLGQRWRPRPARAAVPAARDGIERPPRARVEA
jgi:hypothetical protein